VLALGVQVVARAMELRRLVEALCLAGGASDVRRAPLNFSLFSVGVGRAGRKRNPGMRACIL